MRNTADTMSAAPAAARHSSPSHSTSVVPNNVMDSPHRAIATRTAMPWRCTRENQPENSTPSRAPAAREL